jgi:3-oxoacyl-[acyl-carrier-protein] synthase III
MGSAIHSVATFLPETTLTNDDLEREFPDWSGSKIEKKVGIRSRHISASDQTALDLGFEAAQKVLRNFNREKIEFLIFCTQSPDYFLPTGACILQNRLGLNTSTGAFDFNLGCSGYVYGLNIAKSLIASETAEHILLITADTYSKHLKETDVANRSIFGDGAAATIVSHSENEKIKQCVLGSDGAGAENLIVRGNAFRKNPYDDVGCHLHMDGAEIFNFTIESVPKLVNAVLKKNELVMDDLDYVIFHQANSFILNHLRKKIKIPSEKFYVNMATTGNTVSATIGIALKDAFDQGAVKEGDKVLLVGFGVGYSWGATIVII